jgi:uncharacterized repeat protein (TIGR01451 family)
MTTASTRSRSTSWFRDLFRKHRRDRLRKKPLARYRPWVERLEDRWVPTGGDFSLDFVAAAPFTYHHSTGGGAFDDRTIGKTFDVVESLQGGDFSCGDTVTYLVQISVAPGAVGAQTIELDFRFLSDTTGQSGADHDDILNVAINSGAIAQVDVNGDGTPDVIGDGPGQTDSGNLHDGGSVATLVSETLPSNPFHSGTTHLKGTVRITDLEAGDKVILRLDVHIDCAPGSSPTGNLQAAITAGRVGDPVFPKPGDRAISIGNQTVPFKNIGELAVPALNIVKDVSSVTNPDGSAGGAVVNQAGDKINYAITVQNTGNVTLTGVTVTDPFADPGSIVRGADVVGDNDALLEVGETWAFTAVHTVTQAEIDSNGGGDGLLENTATAHSNQTPDDSDDASVPVEQIIDLSLTKEADKEHVPAGEDVTFTITVRNDGFSAATGVQVSDVLPVELTFVSASFSDPTDTYNPGTGIWNVGTLAVGASATLTLVATPTATVPPGGGGGPLAGNFEIDGNLLVDTAGKLDWANAPNLRTADDLPTGQTDDSFGQGSKEDDAVPTVVTGSIPNNKSDLTHFYISDHTVDGHVLVYLAWVRANTLGTANMDFEFNQSDILSANGKTPVRTDGDILITFDFAQGGNTVQLGLRRWDAAAGAWGASVDLDSSGFAIGAVNSVDGISDPISGGTLDINTFGEAAIDLTAAGVFPAGECVHFGRAYVKSRSSTAFNSEMKDFIAPIEVNIDNCEPVTNTAEVIAADQVDIDSTPNNHDPTEDDQDSVTVEVFTGGSALTAAALGDGAVTEALTEQGLQRILAGAVEHWHAADLAPQHLSALGHVTFHITDLPGAQLGWASGREIWIDVDAAGWGWSFGAAPGRMDLGAAVTHELGHVLGFTHSDTGVMAAFLAAGLRLTPAASPPGGGRRDHVGAGGQAFGIVAESPGGGAGGHVRASSETFGNNRVGPGHRPGPPLTVPGQRGEPLDRECRRRGGAPGVAGGGDGVFGGYPQYRGSAGDGSVVRPKDGDCFPAVPRLPQQRADGLGRAGAVPGTGNPNLPPGRL